MIRVSTNTKALSRIFAIHFAATLIILCSLAIVVQAQSSGQTIPDRGFHPSASYSLSNIETQRDKSLWLV
jgi:hypothetical protein